MGRILVRAGSRNFPRLNQTAEMEIRHRPRARSLIASGGGFRVLMLPSRCPLWPRLPACAATSQGDEGEKGGHGLKGKYPLEQLIFVVIPLSEPMTTGLYWYLHYWRGTGDLSQIIVMDQSGDPWLQDPVFKRSGEARPGESAPALIKRYRAEMIRRTEADPAQAGKKA